jgi:hypothetical protein
MTYRICTPPVAEVGLAFDLPTATGFHMLRATEAVLIEYKTAAGVKKSKTRNWNKYIQDLKAAGADQKIVAILDQIRDLHRNPLMHPEVVLTMPEASAIFGICQSAITIMAQDMEKRATKTASPPVSVSASK